MIRTETSVAEYRRNYNRGWKAGSYDADGALERADGRGESHGWYDGYMDAATGRDKWHIPNCPDHGKASDEYCADTTGAKPPTSLKGEPS